jgi:beta-glucosidase
MMNDKVSRRKFAQLLGGVSAALTLPEIAQGKVLLSSDPEPQHATRFPTDFLWGSATASYQVEGAVKEGGRGPSIWDTFSHTPGKVHHGDTGDVADDYYHRYLQDIQLMRNIGLKTCRFSVAWTRIFPNGKGTPNQTGLDFYRRMVDALLEAGIEPYCTLYHWDLPQPLQDRGGWENRDTASLFADYAGYTAGQLSGKVKHFMTMNEMRTFVELGYGNGTHAPGLQLDQKRLAQLAHYVVLGHGMAVRSIRAAAKPGTMVGIADNVLPMCPVYESREHIEAARKALRQENAMFLTVVQEGRYTDEYLKRLGGNAPHFTDEEMKIIGSPMDFTGINIYQPVYVRASGSESGYEIVPPPSSYPHMYSEWLNIGPEALYWGPKLVHETWNVQRLYITENGASSADRVAADGNIYDTDRVMFLRNYLQNLQRAVSEGVPVKGYFLWSLLDNFEWADGYEKRFGITYVDFTTQKRTPKLSAAFYKQVIATNTVC